LSAIRTWKASSSTPSMVPKMPGLMITLSPAFRVCWSSSSFFCLLRIGMMSTK
jgi:hypothetical protein